MVLTGVAEKERKSLRGRVHREQKLQLEQLGTPQEARHGRQSKTVTQGNCLQKPKGIVAWDLSPRPFLGLWRGLATQRLSTQGGKRSGATILTQLPQQGSLF